jgi:hypothetical protein
MAGILPADTGEEVAKPVVALLVRLAHHLQGHFLAGQPSALLDTSSSHFQGRINPDMECLWIIS